MQNTGGLLTKEDTGWGFRVKGVGRASKGWSRGKRRGRGKGESRGQRVVNDEWGMCSVPCGKKT